MKAKGLTNRWLPGIVAMAGFSAVTAVVVLLVLVNGGYNVAATVQHTGPVYTLLEIASRQSIAHRARAIDVPPLTDPAMLDRGLQLYRAHCVQCHGAPGVAPEAFALGLTPLPANLALRARKDRSAELFWAIKYGLKMTAMPAWEFRLKDDDLWALTAFIAQLAVLSPADYRRWVTRLPPLAPGTALSAEPPPPAPDLARGAIALQQYACVTCHEIPGVVAATKPVGPPLAGIATRRYIAGVLPNTPENMHRWLRAPTAVDPQTAMPDLQVSDRDARDIAAFLATLR